MNPVCDFLFSADLCVPAKDAALEELVGALGLPVPGAGAHVVYPHDGWDCVFALVSKAFAAAPTRLEVIAPLDGADVAAPRFGRRVYDGQAPRAVRTHATVVAVPDMARLVERVRASGVAHWLQEPAEDVPFQRLWMGAAPGDLGHYTAAADCGLRIEFIPSDSNAFSPKLFVTPVDEPRPGEVGYRRIIARDYGVADLDAALAHMDRVFGWDAAHGVRDVPERGYRYATMAANHAHGAALRLVEQTGGGAGPGPLAIVIAAFDLEATAQDLERRGTRFVRLRATAHEPEALVPALSAHVDAIRIVQEHPIR